MAASYRKDNEHFMFVNRNPKKYVSSGDCVVRAISAALGEPWETTYLGLCKIGYELCAMPNDDKVYERYLEEHGWAKQKQARKPDNTKYTAAEFARMSAKGITAVIRVANHLSAVSNGYILDTWDCGEKTVGNFWTKR